MITIIGLDDFPTQLAVRPLADGRTALACTHMPTPGTSEIAYSAAYLVSGGIATKIGQSEPYGKDIACGLLVRNRVLELYVTEAPPGGSGAAARLDRYDFFIGVDEAGGGSGGAGIDQALRNALAALPK